MVKDGKRGDENRKGQKEQIESDKNKEKKVEKQSAQIVLKKTLPKPTSRIVLRAPPSKTPLRTAFRAKPKSLEVGKPTGNPLRTNQPDTCKSCGNASPCSTYSLDSTNNTIGHPRSHGSPSVSFLRVRAANITKKKVEVNSINGGLSKSRFVLNEVSDMALCQPPASLSDSARKEEHGQLSPTRKLKEARRYSLEMLLATREKLSVGEVQRDTAAPIRSLAALTMVLPYEVNDHHRSDAQIQQANESCPDREVVGFSRWSRKSFPNAGRSFPSRTPQCKSELYWRHGKQALGLGQPVENYQRENLNNSHNYKTSHQGSRVAEGTSFPSSCITNQDHIEGKFHFSLKYKGPKHEARPALPNSPVAGQSDFQNSQNNFSSHTDERLSGNDITSTTDAYLGDCQNIYRRNPTCIHSPARSIKWDPTIVEYGPITAAEKMRRDGMTQVSKNIAESTTESNIEALMRTLKRSDRRAIQTLLKALKDLDSDTDSVDTPHSREGVYQSSARKYNSGKGLNPQAPVFQGNSSKRAEKENTHPLHLTVPKKRPHSLQHEVGLEDIYGQVKISSKRISSAVQTYVGSSTEQKLLHDPIGKDTFIPPLAVRDIQAHRDEELNTFCTINSLIPISPVSSLYPFLPLLHPSITAPSDQHDIDSTSNSLQAFESVLAGKTVGTPPSSQALPRRHDYRHRSRIPTLKQGLSKGWTSQRIASDVKLGRRVYNEPQINMRICSSVKDQAPPAGKVDTTFTTSEEDSSRVACVLDAGWAGQILDKFTKKYPLTGQHESAAHSSESDSVIKIDHWHQPSTLQRATMTPSVSIETRFANQTPQLRSIITRIQQMKDAGLRVAPEISIRARHAAEIQQRLEMLILQKKEQEAFPVRRQNSHAAQIQQRLEMLLLEQKQKIMAKNSSENNWD